MMLKAIIQALEDFFIQYVSIRKKHDIDFAFILHARHASDAFVKFPFLKMLPQSWVHTFLAFLWPIRLSEITGVRTLNKHKPLRGMIIAVPMTAAHMIQHKRRAKKRISHAVSFAEKLGARVIGLGAYTSSLTDNGSDVQKHATAAITNGNTLTAIVSAENIANIANETGKELQHLYIAILGATGSVGKILSRLLLKYGAQEILFVSRTIENLEKLRFHLAAQFPDRMIRISTDINALASADLIITATNSPHALVRSEHLKKGAMVYDISQPKNVLSDVIAARRDCRFYEGGMVISPPSIDYHFDFSLKQGRVFACLAETVTLAAAEVPREKIAYGDDAYADLIKKYSSAVGFHSSYYEL